MHGSRGSAQILGSGGLAAAGGAGGSGAHSRLLGCESRLAARSARRFSSASMASPTKSDRSGVRSSSSSSLLYAAGGDEPRGGGVRGGDRLPPDGGDRLSLPSMPRALPSMPRALPRAEPLGTRAELVGVDILRASKTHEKKFCPFKKGECGSLLSADRPFGEARARPGMFSSLVRNARLLLAYVSHIHFTY